MYVRVPTARPRTPAQRVLAVTTGALLAPIFGALASILGVPGIRSRLRCMPLGTRLLIGARGSGDLSRASQVLLMPMDSTRYFEFDFVDRAVRGLPVRRYLDVSSPRLVPVLLARARPDVVVDMINPDGKDLAESRALVQAARLSERITLHECLVHETPFKAGTFDLITCVSVLEHIPDDGTALRAMLEMLRPGGTLVLTLPCMSRAAEQYIDHDEYGLLETDPNGFVFWQRYYDAESLRSRVFTIAGEPSRSEVYGEKVAGSFQRNAQAKRTLGVSYPYWREPCWVSRAFRPFRTVDDLSGEGVIGLTFVRR
jgi:SAM-dependent methyltransferase